MTGMRKSPKFGITKVGSFPLYLRGKTPASISGGIISNYSFSAGVGAPSEINDARACGKADAAFRQPAQRALTMTFHILHCSNGRKK